MDTTALIAAAGNGTRLGLGPKAFVTVRGRTLLDLCIESFAGQVGEVVVALPADDMAAFAGSRRGVRVVAGGVTRQESVAAMLAVTSSRFVLIHDVARPFLTPAVIERVSLATRSHGAATAVLDVADTVIDVGLGTTLDRSILRLVQTPQGFETTLLVEAHEAARGSGVAATDDADLVRRLGRRVALVEGSRLLHKLTGPEDLVLATALHDLWALERGTVGADG